MQASLEAIPRAWTRGKHEIKLPKMFHTELRETSKGFRKPLRAKSENPRSM